MGTESILTNSMSLVTNDTNITANNYISWERKLSNFIKKAEIVMFASVHSMVQENSFRIKYSLIGVAIDFLQIFAFSLSSDFGWGQEYDAISSVVLGPIRMMSWLTFEIIFWVTIGVLGIVFVIAWHVGHTFALGDFTRMWPIRFMRTFANLLLGVLFIPVVTILLTPLKTDLQGNVANFSSEGIVAFSSSTLPLEVVAIVALIAFVPFCLILSLMNFEYSPNTRDAMARHTAWFDFIYLILKTIIVLVTNLLPASTGAVIFRAVTLLLATIFVSVFLVLIVPYYKPWINTLRAILFSGLLGASISTMVRVFLNNTWHFSDMPVVVPFVIHIVLMAIFAAAGGIAMMVRIKTLVRREWINKQTANLPSRSPSVLTDNPRRRMYLSGRIGGTARRHGSVSSHMTGEIRGVIDQERLNAHSSSTSGVLSGAWHSLRCFYVVSRTVAHTIFLQRKAAEEEVVLAETYFQRMIDCCGECPSLSIHLANLIISYRHDWIGATAQIRKAQSKNLGFFQRWQTYLVIKRIEREKRARRTGTTKSMDLMRYVEFQSTLSRARKHHLKSLKHIRKFWEALQYESGDRAFKLMGRELTRAVRTESRALYAYSRLIDTFPSSPVLWRSYGAFLQDVCMEIDEANAALQTADEIEERLAHKSHQHNYDNLTASRIGATSAERDLVVTRTGGSHDNMPLQPLDMTGYIGTHLNSISVQGETESPTISSNEETPMIPEDGVDNVPLEVKTCMDMDRISDKTSEKTESEVGTHKTRTSLDSSKLSSTLQIQKETDSSKGTKRLHRALLWALVVMLVAAFGNWVTIRELILAQDTANTNMHDAIDGGVSMQLAGIAAEELALAMFFNGSLGLDEVASEWKIIPNGEQAYYAATLEYTNRAAQLADALYGGSDAFGYGTDLVWQNSRVYEVEYPSMERKQVTLKESIDRMTLSIKNLMRDVVQRTITRSEVSSSSDLAYIMANGMDVGDENDDNPWNLLSNAYAKALGVASLTLRVVVVSIVGIASLLLLSLTFKIVRPTIDDIHHSAHFFEAMLMNLPTDEISKIIQRVKQCEEELLYQLNDRNTVGDDNKYDNADNDDTTQHSDSDDRTAIAHRKSIKRRRVDDLTAHKIAMRLNKKEKEMNHIWRRYAIAILLVIAVILSQCVELLVMLSRGEVDATVGNYAAARLYATAEAFRLTYELPVYAREAFPINIGDVGNLIEQEIARISTLHEWITYGRPTEGITGTYEYIQEYQKTQFEIISSRLEEYRDALRNLVAANATALDFTHPAFKTVHELWNQPGTLKLAEEETVNIYFDHLKSIYALVGMHNSLWFVGQLVLLVIIYTFMVRTIVTNIREKNKIIDRLSLMISPSALTTQQMLAEYFGDRAEFVNRVREKAAQKKAAEEVDDTWALRLIQRSLKPHVVLNHKRNIIFHNDAASKFFSIKSDQQIKHQRIDVLVAPAYRAKLDATLSAAESDLGGTHECMLMIEQPDGKITTLARMMATAFDGTERKTKIGLSRRISDRMILLVWESAEVEVGGDRTQSVAAEAAASSVLWRISPIVVLTVTGKILKMNEKAREILEVAKSPERLSFADLFLDEEQESVQQLLDLAVSSPARLASKRLHLARTLYHVTIVSTQYDNATSGNQYLIVLLEDLSSQVAIQQSVRNSEQMHQALVSVLPVGVVGIDKNDEIVLFNAEATQLFGYPMPEALGQNIAFLFQNWPEVQSNCCSEAHKNEWTPAIARLLDGTTVAVRVRMNQLDHNSGHATTIIFVDQNSWHAVEQNQ